MAVLYQVVHGAPPLPSRVAGVPEAFDAVFGRGIAKAPDERFGSAPQLADALAAAGRSLLGR